MTKYMNLSGKGDAFLYQINTDELILIFRSKTPGKGGKYVYNTDSMERHNLEEMMRLAERGEGLRTFINKNRRSGLVDHAFNVLVDVDETDFL